MNFSDHLLGMYCKKGPSGRDDKDTNTVVQPMRGVSPVLPLNLTLSDR